MRSEIKVEVWAKGTPKEGQPFDGESDEVVEITGSPGEILLMAANTLCRFEEGHYRDGREVYGHAFIVSVLRAVLRVLESEKKGEK